MNAPLLSALSVGPARVPRAAWPRPVGQVQAGDVPRRRRPGAGGRLAMLALLAMLASCFAVGLLRGHVGLFPFCWQCWLFVFDSQHCQQTAVCVVYQFENVGIVGYVGTRFKSLAPWHYMQLLYIYNTIFNFFVSNFA